MRLVAHTHKHTSTHRLSSSLKIRKKKLASVWQVAWSGGLRWEGPVCHNGHAKWWHAAISPSTESIVQTMYIDVDITLL